ncbi:MAG: hypothetical protein J5525_00795 [Lachnospiraceae bacterium]|nr:hypothetical protein [Lachnospiraceae bacterium]
MYNSLTYGKLNIENIPAKLLAYYDRVKGFDSPIQIIVGTDSQNHSNTKIVTVIAIVCEGHSGIYFYEISHVSKINDIRQKLFKETTLSLKTADTVLEIIENDPIYGELYDNSTFTIHVDAGKTDRSKTSELIPSIVGWIKSVGYECEVKPDSFVSSTIADRLSK